MTGNDILERMEQSEITEANKNETLYAKRDPMILDDAGNFYCKHVMAMTTERLNSKSDIAAELGYRDMKIAELTNLLIERDGGSHDIDCKERYGKPCNCLHDEVKRYLSI